LRASPAEQKIWARPGRLRGAEAPLFHG